MKKFKDYNNVDRSKPRILVTNSGYEYLDSKDDILFKTKREAMNYARKKLNAKTINYYNDTGVAKEDLTKRRVAKRKVTKRRTNNFGFGYNPFSF